jgi:type IV pilus assembly protein PilN
MILINLLPHREAARERQKKQFYTQLVLSMLLGAAISGGVYMWFDAQLSEQQDRNNLLKKQMAILDAEIKDIAGLQAEIASLRARQTAVENLQADRNMPVHLVNEIVSRLPEGIYLRSLKQENQNVLLSGIAQSQERVSELLRSLSNQPDLWLGSPELVEIVASSANVSQREQRRVSNFTVRVVLKRPGVGEKPDDMSGKAPAPSKKV